MSPIVRPWREDIIYMILVDRFHRGGGVAAREKPQPPFWGGNLAGILEKLDYLQDLGVTALWLSPLYRNQPDGYHGYWPVDFFSVDPRFGTLAELVDLTQECHRRGLKVILDMVLNHAGYLHPMTRDPRYRGWFHREWDVRWTEQRRLEIGSLHGLPDFAHENPQVRNYLIDMSLWWLEQTGVDGFRLDAVKHVPIYFWNEFSRKIHERAGENFLLLGEVFRGIPNYIARYQSKGGIDAPFDVPFADTVRCALARDSEEPGPSFLERFNELRREYKTMLYNEVLRKLFAWRPTDMRWFSSLLDAESCYAKPEFLCPIIDNHDLNRFITEAGGSKARLKMALALLLTWRGIPVITFGTECGMGGRTEGTNRAPMAFGSDGELYDFTRKLIRLRKTRAALTSGRIIQVHADREIFAFVRESKQERVLVAVNNSASSQERTFEFPSDLPASAAWSEEFDSNAITREEDELQVRLGPRSVKIWSSGNVDKQV